MTDGALGTYTKFKNLLRHMSATELSNLFQVFGFNFVTTQWISRVSATEKFNHDIGPKIRPLILRVEDLIERFKPGRLSFSDSEHIKLLLDVIGAGVDLGVGAPISINNSSSNQHHDSPAAE